jgi:hypothetical protein
MQPRICLSLSTVGLLLLAGSALAQEPAQFTALFDGKTFDGWEGNRSVFRLEEGAIVGGSLKQPVARNEFLCTKKTYGDFELRLKFKLLGNEANGGVQIRSRRIPNHHEMIGYQADIAEGFWGCLYDESRRNKVLAGPAESERGQNIRRQDWNDYVIRCEGPRIRLWVNGRQTADFTESDASIPLSGVVGLQIHGGPASEAWYKDISIREVPPRSQREIQP